MSAEGQLIVCRRCNEAISLEQGSCPHCGTTIRGTVTYVVAILFGVVLAAASLFNVAELLAFGVLGVFVAATAGYMFYNKRQRIRKASER